MRVSPGGLLVCALLLTGCVDFVDPVGLGLARNTRIEVDFDLVDDPRRSSCGAPPALLADSALLCVRATLTPGVTRVGERLRVLDDTLWAMDVPLLPAGGADGALRYEGRFALPAASLAEVPYTAFLPRVEGAEIRPREIRWYAVGRAGADTLSLGAGEGVRLGLELPMGLSTPAPAFEFWSVEMAGDTATSLYSAFGVPRAEYRFPPEVLAALGGGELRGELRWQRTYAPAGEGVELIVRFLERLRWAAHVRQ